MIAIFGDSFAEGVGDDDGGGWVKRLGKKLKPDMVEYVSGVGGRNIYDIKKSVHDYLERRTPSVLILNVGINDSRYRESKNGMEVEPKTFGIELGELCEYASHKGAHHIFIIGTSRVDEDLVLNYKPDKSHTNKGAELIDYEISATARKFRHIYIPIAHRIGPNTERPVLSDGLHPNALGHEIVSDLVHQSLVDNLAI